MVSSCLLFSHSIDFLTKLPSTTYGKLQESDINVYTVHYGGSMERASSISDPMVAFGSSVDLNTPFDQANNPECSRTFRSTDY